MAKKLTIEEVKRRLYEIHGDMVTLDESTYVNTNVKARLVDKECGEWWAIPNNVFCKKNCHPLRGQQNRKQTMLEKYGCEHPSQSKQIQQKIKQTFLKKYGVKNPNQNKEVRQKIKQTCLEKYGCESPLQSQEIQEKKKQTCIEKYGCENISQSKEIALKVARSQNNSTILKHWKTGQDVVCVAGWEPKVVQYFNDKQIDYKWQEQFFMPDGKSYTVDAYLPEQDLYIEIKGYFYKDAKEKWDWFHKEHPNSELWDKQKLKQLKIL
jgi:hypothetical protein